jgi:3-deoxy-D-manno-octulosonic-acid transferase
MWLAQPFLRRKLARRGQAEPGYLEAVEERFGRYSRTAPPGMVWLHAVSLGETRAAAVLLEALRAREPGLRVLLTHGTATGRAEGQRLLRPGDAQAWQPWDTPGAVRAFWTLSPAPGRADGNRGLAQPGGAVPGPWRAAGAGQCAAERQVACSSRWRCRRCPCPPTRPDGGVGPDPADAQRLRQPGAPVQGVFGNLKFDATPDAAQLAQGRAWRAAGGRPVVMFASSREREEAALLACHPRARGWMPRAVQWLIVPRHPQRFDEVAALVQAEGFSLSRRSVWARRAARRPTSGWAIHWARWRCTTA